MHLDQNPIDSRCNAMTTPWSKILSTNPCNNPPRPHDQIQWDGAPSVWDPFRSKCLRPISGKSQVTCDLAIFTLMLTKNYSMCLENKTNWVNLHCRIALGFPGFLAELNQCWNQQKTNLQKYPQTIVMEPNHNIEQHISGNVRHSLFAMWAMINTTALSHEILVDQ